MSSINNNNNNLLILQKMALAGCSNMAGASVTNPIDVAKVRMQLEGAGAELRMATTATSSSIACSTQSSRSLLGAGGFSRGLVSIYKTEGASGLYKGLGASLLREASYSSIRLGLYDPVKSLFVSSNNNDNPQNLPLYKKILAGGCTGALGSAIANPADLIKIRMQGDVAKQHQGQTARYSSVVGAFRDIVKKEGGVRGLYVGVAATTQRAALLTATQIPSYDHSKQFLLQNGYMQEGMALHGVCSMFAGFMTATITSPVDVIKTRVMNANNAGNANANNKQHNLVLYRRGISTMDAAKKILQMEGLRGMYKGWFANWMRIGPHTIVTLRIFEQLRAFTGMPPF